jgi:hypothetical protein
MNYLYLRGFILYIFFALCLAGTSNAQSSFKYKSKHSEKALFGKSTGNKKKSKTKDPGSVGKAKKKQEKNEKRLKKATADYVKQSRKRSYDIQSPEVQSRMKQNEKDTAQRDKDKKKKAKSTTRKAGKKYH